MMTQFYTDESRETETHALPDAEVFQLTAREAAEYCEEDIYQFSKRHEFRLASMNSRDRDAMFDAMIEELGITGGWFYWFCFPGCLPDSTPFGPFDTRQEAIDAAREDCAE